MSSYVHFGPLGRRTPRRYRWRSNSLFIVRVMVRVSLTVVEYYSIPIILGKSMTNVYYTLHTHFEPLRKLSCFGCEGGIHHCRRNYHQNSYWNLDQILHHSRNYYRGHLNKITLHDVLVYFTLHEKFIVMCYIYIICVKSSHVWYIYIYSLMYFLKFTDIWY